MSNVYRLLTKLTLNRRFAQDFLDAPEPCCALSVIEERKQVLPLVAFRPGVVLPYGVTEQGFDFGHSVLGGDSYEIVHFAFKFRGFCTYNVLVNPSDPVAREVIRHLVEHRCYVVLAVDPDQHVAAFKAGVGEVTLSGLIDHYPRIARSITSRATYGRVLAQFRRRPQPSGQMLNWACRSELSYLDLTTDRMELSPAPMPESSDGVSVQ